MVTFNLSDRKQTCGCGQNHVVKTYKSHSSYCSKHKSWIERKYIWSMKINLKASQGQLGKKWSEFYFYLNVFQGIIVILPPNRTLFGVYKEMDKVWHILVKKTIKFLKQCSRRDPFCHVFLVACAIIGKVAFEFNAFLWILWLSKIARKSN